MGIQIEALLTGGRVPMKLLLISNNLETFGGGERWVMEVASRLGHFYEITILSVKTSGDKKMMDLAHLVREYKIKARIVNLDCVGMKSQIRAGKFTMAIPKPHALYKLYREVGLADVVYAVSTNPVVLVNSIFASKIYGKRFILGLHNPIILREEDMRGGKSSKFQGMLLKIVPEMHAQTKTQLEMLKLSGYRGKVYYVPHFMYLKPSPSRGSARKATFDVLFVGRFDVYQKGLDLLVKIIKATTRRDSDIRFTLIGSGGEEGKAMIKKLESEEPRNVKWHGFVTEKKLNETYGKADLFILPSRYETPGLSLLEAQGHGIPAIAFNVQGPRDIMERPIQGELVKPYDISAFVDRILEYKRAYRKSPSAYRKKFPKIRRQIETVYSEQNFIRSFRKMISQR